MSVLSIFAFHRIGMVFGMDGIDAWVSALFVFLLLNGKPQKRHRHALLHVLVATLACYVTDVDATV